MTAVAIVLIYAFLETIIKLIANGAMYIAGQILVPEVYLFAEDGNLFSSLFGILPTSTITSVMSAVVKGVALAILMINVLLVGLNATASPFTGKHIENPAQSIARIILTAVGLVAVFGIGISNVYTSGIMGMVGKVFAFLINQITDGLDLQSMRTSVFDMSVFTLNQVSYIGILIMVAALLTSVIGAAIVYLERVISFLLTIMFGPVCIACMANKETQDIGKNWIMSIFTQFFAILLSLYCWRLFALQVSSDSGGSEIFKYALAIAILSFARNSERIFQIFGLRTMPNGESARMVVSGVGGLLTTAMAVSRIARPLQKAFLSKGSDTGRPYSRDKSPVVAKPDNPSARMDDRYQNSIRPKIDRAAKDKAEMNDARRRFAEADNNYSSLRSSGVSENIVRDAGKQRSDAVLDENRAAQRFSESYGDLTKEASLESSGSIISGYGIERDGFIPGDNPIYDRDSRGNDYMVIEGTGQNAASETIMIPLNEGGGGYAVGESVNFTLSDEKAEMIVDGIISTDDGTAYVLHEKHDNSKFDEILKRSEESRDNEDNEQFEDQ